MGAFIVNSAAQAQEKDYRKGIYVGLKTSMFFSPSWQNTLEINGLGNFHQKSKLGFALQASVGYDWGKHLRSEIEVGYKFHQTKNLIGSGATIETGGRINQITLKENLYIDIPLGHKIEFFVGGGFGLSIVSSKNYHIESTNQKIIKGSTIAFSYQFMTGLGYQMTNDIVLSFEYRYSQTREKRLKNNSGLKVDGDFNAHQIGFGIRYTF